MFYTPFADAASDLTTKHGIDKLDIMIKIMRIVTSKGRKISTNFDKFKSFLVQQLQRGLTPAEIRDLSKGLLDYINSEEGSNERFKAMEYLFNLEFLTD